MALARWPVVPDRCEIVLVNRAHFQDVAAILEAMSLGAPGGQGQDRIQAIEGLNRRFLVDGKYGSCGGLRYRPMTSAAFRSKSGSSDNMYRSNRCGFRRARCHALWT